MLLFIVRVLYLLIATGAAATYTLGQGTGAPQVVTDHPVAAFALLVLVTWSVVIIDWAIPKKRVEIASAIYFGLLIGVLLSYLFHLALRPLFAMQELFGDEGLAFQGGATLVTLTILPYLCISFLLQTKDDFRFVIPYVEFSRELKGGRPLVLDSSALIDGRIADVVDTNIVDADLLVPQFILQEVQDIADSHDKVRRGRGRRGLDVLKRLQTDPKVDVRIQESDAGRGQSVDQRLIEICKQLHGRLVTNDLNLNKLASVQGIDVINFNDVANSLKPKFIPGEHVRIKIIKEGESPGQGVGYLDDGTMVVVEQGYSELGHEVDTVVTRELQNSAGRMLFCRVTADGK